MDNLEKHIKSIQDDLNFQAPRKEEIWTQIAQELDGSLGDGTQGRVGDTSAYTDGDVSPSHPSHHDSDHHHHHVQGSKWWTSLVGLTMLGLVIVGLVLGGKVLLSPQQKTLKTSPQSEATEVDFYYAKLVKDQVERLRQSSDLTDEEKEDFLEYISELSAEQALLTAELKQNVDNEQLLKATITNFKQQIKLIEQLLERVESRKLKKYESDGIFM